MSDTLSSISRIAASGMKAQGQRMQIISENLANAESTSQTPGGDPYRRKTIAFGSYLDRSLGAELVDVKNVGRDMSEFRLTYDPGHPAADGQGYVKKPNVNTLIEMADMREASRSYEANLNMLDTGRQMKSKTLDILR